MRMRGILLIPFKSLATAKQRLAEALDARQRSQLAEAMLRDVMAAAAGVKHRIDVALVTGDTQRAGDRQRTWIPGDSRYSQ